MYLNEVLFDAYTTRCTVAVWAMMDNTGVLSFDISCQTMNGERYCAVLKDHVIPFFQWAENRHRFYQQDGAPPHYSSAARAILDKNLPNRWIGRRGPIEWPPRSPDLSRLPAIFSCGAL